MKKNMIISWIFCSLHLLGYAQPKEDYLLTLNQDTLFGKILTEANGLAAIKFIYKGKKMTYHPSSIQFFGIYREGRYQHFRTFKSEEGRAFFVQIMTIGKIKLYKYSEEHIFTDATLSRYVYLMRTTDDDLTTISSSSYQRILGDFLKDKPSLLAQLANTTFAEVPQLIKQHNKKYR